MALSTLFLQDMKLLKLVQIISVDSVGWVSGSASVPSNLSSSPLRQAEQE